MQNKMQRKLGQNTGTCFQRCVGMDAFNSLYSVTYEMDEAHGTEYHQRLKDFITMTHQTQLCDRRCHDRCQRRSKPSSPQTK